MLLSKRLFQTLMTFCFCLSSCICVESTTISGEDLSEKFTDSTAISVNVTSANEASTHKEFSPFVTSSTTSKPQANTSDILSKWLQLEKNTKLFAKNVVKSLIPALMEGGSNMNISDKCRRDVLTLLAGFRDIKTWAFSMFDASGKLMDGLLSGTMASIGEYDQCLDIKATNDKKGKNSGKVLFTGQYCALDIKPPLPPKTKYYKLNGIAEELREFSKGDNIINEAAKASQFFHFIAIRLGLCVPSGCSATDMQEVITTLFDKSLWNGTIARCELKQENEYTPLIIGVMTALCFFGFLLTVGSLIDLYHKYAQKKLNNTFLEVLVSFSFVANFKKLINTKSSQGSMSCLNGVRFLSISWIILGHTYLNTNYMIARSLRRATIFQKDFFFQAVVNASVAVDTFFFMGGLLVCYVIVKVTTETQKPFSILLYVLHRLFRLLPLYIMVIAFIYLAPLMCSGPVYHDVIDNFMDACYKNWWTNILFVNNFINTDQICLPQSWYVACDMQLYIAALIVILPLLRWPKVGLSIAALGVLASVVGTTWMTYIYEYPPTMLFIHPDLEQRIAYWANAYFKPYSHAGPYCIGLIIGYVLATQPKLKFSRSTRIIGWLAATACNMAVLYGVYEWNTGRDPELAETLFYSGLHRLAWTLGVAWVIVNCATGQGGVVNYILSWKVWVPLGRLTYGLYLIHPIVQIAALSNVRIRLQTQHFFAVWIYFGHLMITIGSAFVACMLVEAPFISLEKILLRKIAGQPKSSANNHAPDVSNAFTDPKSSHNADHMNIRHEPVSHL